MENVVSHWKQAIALAAKVGKGLCKDNKAQVLHAKYWLEAIDPLHRYGKDLKKYYDVWLNSHSSEPFLYWLDFGYGKEIDLKECPRTELQRQRVQYLRPTIEGTKWIFVLCTSRKLFVGQKERGLFQHSSFLAGAATVAAGRLVVSNGMLEAIWAYSGHYCTTEEHFAQLIQFLDEKQVDLRNVKMYPIDDDVPPTHVPKTDTTRDSSHSGIDVPPINIELSETHGDEIALAYLTRQDPMFIDKGQQI